MKRIIAPLFALLVASLIGCVEQSPSDAQPKHFDYRWDNSVTEIHDREHGVTCWAMRSGISCLPDSALRGRALPDSGTKESK